MKHDNRLDEVFERFLPSATQAELESARSRILDRVRANIAAGQDRVAGKAALNHGDYQILLALENGERHAYAIASDVQELTEGATKFGPGTLFTSISRLLRTGLIEETHERVDIRINEEPRQYYELTGIGRGVLASESERLATKLFHAHRQQAMRLL